MQALIIIKLTSYINKGHFRKRNITQASEGQLHFLIINGSIHQKDIIILNIYEIHNRPSKYMKQLTEMK